MKQWNVNYMHTKVMNCYGQVNLNYHFYSLEECVTRYKQEQTTWMPADFDKLEKMTEKSSLSVRGIVVYVNNADKYGYLQSEYYGRILIRKHFNNEVVNLGAWLSFHVAKNCDPILTISYTHCQFSDVSEPQAIEMLVPSGMLARNAGIEQVLVISPIYVGRISHHGGVGLSPLFGRVFFSQARLNKFHFKSLSWIKVSMISVNPTAENYFCYWEVRMVREKITSEEKTGIYKIKQDFQLLSIYKFACAHQTGINFCRAVYSGVTEENFFLLQLLGTDMFARAYATDFTDDVNMNLLLNREIEVIACKPLSADYRVPVCFATLVGSKQHLILQRTNLDLFEGSLQISKSEDTSAALTAECDKKLLLSDLNTDGEVPGLGDKPKTFDLSICNPICETTNIILEIMKDESFVEVCKAANLDLCRDLKAFAEQCRLKL
uniref:Protein kinase domain-containing protein n=1 Tax=Syphacia muris TaxID=451379 RepID=A0A0N5AGV4_9BILA